jgi:hypothetical protein
MNKEIVITRHRDDIVTHENFLTKDECESILKVIKIKENKGEWDWKQISFYESSSGRMPELNDADVIACGLPGNFFDNLRERIIVATADMAKKDPSQMSRISFHSQRWEPGAFAHPHSDNTSNEGVSGAFTRSRYATFLYLNDDFEGGVLNFTKTDLTIVPKAGLLATFAGGFHNMHEVTVVKKKVRYTLGSFWDDREESDYPQELRDQWATELKEVRDKQKIEQKEWNEIREKGLRQTPRSELYPASEVEDINE